MRTVTIIAGETITGAWCAPCNANVAVRVPLHLDGVEAAAAFLTVCTECGTRSMPSIPSVELIAAATPRRSWPRPWLALLWWYQRRDCARRGITPRGCALDDCPRPGWWDCAWYEAVDDGRIRWLFCSSGHRARWLDENGWKVMAAR